jgi:hypothetical protein
VALGSTACILCETVKDVALHWVHAFCWSRCFYNEKFVLFWYFFHWNSWHEGAANFASNLAWVQKNLTKRFTKYLVLTLWVRGKPVTGLTGLTMAECQLAMTNVRTIFNWHNAGKCCKRQGHRWMIHDVCNIVELSYGHARVLWWMNWTWDRLLQNSSQGCWVTIRNNPHLSKVITGDEGWIYRYEPETLQQQSQ